MAMNKQVKAAWVKALRSGEYKQGRNWLRTPTTDGNYFCCLGVLCNLHAQAHPEIAAKETNPREYMGQAKQPPRAVLEWAGFKNGVSDCVEIDGCRTTLYTHNDGGCTFEQIATAIEKQL